MLISESCGFFSVLFLFCLEVNGIMLGQILIYTNNRGLWLLGGEVGGSLSQHDWYCSIRPQVYAHECLGHKWRCWGSAGAWYGSDVPKHGAAPPHFLLLWLNLKVAWPINSQSASAALQEPKSYQFSADQDEIRRHVTGSTERNRRIFV